MDVLIPLTEFSLCTFILSLSLSLSFVSSFPAFRCDFRFRTANQPSTTRRDYRNGFNGPRTFKRSSKQRAGNSRYLSAASEERRIELKLASWHFWCGHRCRPWIFHASIVPYFSSYLSPFRLALFLYFFSLCTPRLPFTALCGNPSEPTLRVISQQNLSIAEVTYSSRHHYYKLNRRSDSRDLFLILPILGVSPFASYVRFPRSVRFVSL